MFFEIPCSGSNFLGASGHRSAVGGSVRLQVARVGLHADVAQLVELLICNQQVAGSSPAVGSSTAGHRAWGVGRREIDEHFL